MALVDHIGDLFGSATGNRITALFGIDQFVEDQKQLVGVGAAHDQIVVGVNPYELFLIYNELVAAEDDPALRPNIAYMIDQSHNEKPKIEAMLQSVMNCQTAYARALLVDRAALTQAQKDGDIIGAEEILQAAYQTDVRPLLAQVRIDMGLDPDPILAFRASGYLEKVKKERP